MMERPKTSAKKRMADFRSVVRPPAHVYPKTRIGDLPSDGSPCDLRLPRPKFTSWSVIIGDKSPLHQPPDSWCKRPVLDWVRARVWCAHTAGFTKRADGPS